MTIELSSKGGGGLIMPQYNPGQVYIKAAEGSATGASSVAFWDAINLPHTEFGFESVSLVATSDTSEQTIVDISGQEGVLTHVLTPAMAIAGVMTVRITKDGKVLTFTSPSYAGATRFCVGHFPWVRADASVSVATAFYGARDGGYGNTAATYATLSTPAQAILDFTGIKFKDSLKVTIQGSSAIHASLYWQNAAACYLTSIPEGL